MNFKPIVDAIKKVPWDAILEKTEKVATTAAAVGTAIVIWIGLKKRKVSDE